MPLKWQFEKKLKTTDWKIRYFEHVTVNRPFPRRRQGAESNKVETEQYIEIWTQCKIYPKWAYPMRLPNLVNPSCSWLVPPRVAYLHHATPLHTKLRRTSTRCCINQLDDTILKLGNPSILSLVFRSPISNMEFNTGCADYRFEYRIQQGRMSSQTPCSTMLFWPTTILRNPCSTRL